jgi:hypothetical protein
VNIRLGGWQRLSLVLMFAWTIWVGVVTWQQWSEPQDWFAMFEDAKHLDDKGNPISFVADPMTPVIPPLVWSALALWLVPPLGVLATVWSVRWIYRGFRPATRH